MAEIDLRKLVNNPTHLLATEGTAVDSALGYTAISGLPVSTATQTALNAKLGVTQDQNTITYAATVNLDMAALTGKVRTISLTGNLTFTTSNRAAGRQVSLRLISDTSLRNLVFPQGWKFLGNGVPGSIAASKVAVLSITFFGTADSDAVCSYAVEI